MITNTRGGAAVLAGGKSSRMGQDKALLDWGGRTLLEHCLDVVRPLADPVIIVADTPARYPTIGFRVVGDLYPNTGPVGGIVTALDALGPGWHLVVACDMPFLRPEVIACLLASATESHDAVAPWVNGRPEPLCALYRHTCLPIFRAFLLTGRRAAHKALGCVRTLAIDEAILRRADPDLVSFVNLNTPEDARLLENLREED